MYKGVVLAGGKGTRLGELTKVTNKHLLPVGQYPMVYWPLLKLLHSGVKEILLIAGTEHMGDFVELLGSGKSLGVNLTYKVQDEAGGIAQALGLAESFVDGHPAIVLLGDNIFQDSLVRVLGRAREDHKKAWLCLKEVPDPSRYGVADLRESMIINIEEKPQKPKSNYAVTGVYVYPSDVFDVIRQQKPSSRGELEITDVNMFYVREKRAENIRLFGYWTDAGTLESLALANDLVRKEPPNGTG